VHLLAYLPDPTPPPLAAALDRNIAGRTERTPAIVDALRGHGIDITEDDVRREAGGSVAAGRPHVADALVRLGVSADRGQAFVDFLNPGRPGYANRYAVPLEEMIPLVTAAGGVTVIAHPWGRSGGTVLDEEAFAGLRDLGLAGIEVDHQDHAPELRARLRGIAADLDLLVTGSSDHHGLGKVDHDLGVNTTDPEQYERLLSLAAL
jgi:predicted metal-dependent phosphoesterase TrpH